jgi:hypothetical protein
VGLRLRIADSGTLQISDPAPLIRDCQSERHRRVHCIWFVRQSQRPISF